MYFTFGWYYILYVSHLPCDSLIVVVYLFCNNNNNNNKAWKKATI